MPLSKERETTINQIFAKDEAADPWEYVESFLHKIVAPVFPEQVFRLTDYAAVADGITSNTKSFKAAIEACSRAGGGSVVVPEGKYLTGPIYLKSGVNLHLQKGAIVCFSTRPEDYEPLVYTRWEGVELMNYAPLIYAFEEKNIAITGEGILDGQASEQHWWWWRGDPQWGWQEGMPHQNSRGSRESLFEMGEQQLPVQERRFGEGHWLRPPFVQFYRCENVLLKDFTVVNPPMWALNPVLCNNVTLQGVTVEGTGPNVDGCNPESCRGVLIERCYFSVSHDCIAFKSGRNRDGRRITMPTAQVLVRQCTFGRGHGAVTIGSETSGGIREIFVEDCQMKDTALYRALRIKTSSRRGGLIEHIYFRNIQVQQVREQIVQVSMQYEDSGEHFPVIRNIEIRNILVEEGGKTGILLEACPQSPLQNLRFTKLVIRKVARTYNFQHVKNISLEDVSMNGEKIVYELSASSKDSN